MNSDTDPQTSRWLYDIVYARGDEFATKIYWDVIVHQATVVNPAYSTRATRPALTLHAGSVPGALEFNRASADIIRSYRDVAGYPLVFAVNASGGVQHGNGTGLSARTCGWVLDLAA